MAIVCPECDNPLVIDTEEIDVGDTVQCDECGVELEVVTLDPVELTPLDDSGYVEEEDARHPTEDDE